MIQPTPGGDRWYVFLDFRCGGWRDISEGGSRYDGFAESRFRRDIAPFSRDPKHLLDEDVCIDNEVEFGDRTDNFPVVANSRDVRATKW